MRIALGAQVGDVRAMFVCQGMALAATGIVIGACLAAALTRVLSGLLFGVGPMDPLTYVAMSAVLAVIALLATYVPARRASQVDPIEALRTDG